MKILLWDECIDNMGGVERILSTIANSLAKNNNVVVISKYKTRNEKFYQYNEKVQIHYLIDLTKNLSVKCKDRKVLFYFLKVFEKIKAFIVNKFKTFYYMKKFSDIDVIIFGRVFMAIEYLPFIRKKKNKKIIVRDAIHLLFFNHKVKSKMKKLFPKYVTKFIVSSDESIREYKSFFNSSKIKILKVYNPLSIKPIIKSSFQNKTVISVGRFDEQKGFENLIMAFEIVHQHFPDWQLKIYGCESNNYKKYLDKIIENINGSNYVKLLPAATDVVSVFNQSSIFVSTSRYEGYANVLVEAMSCGLPSISYNWLFGVDEIIQHKKNGWVVSLKNREDYFLGRVYKEDIEALAKAIIYLIENPKVCETLSKNAKYIVEDRLENKIMSRWMEFIKEDVIDCEK